MNPAKGAGELPFAGRFFDKPLLAFMGNTVEDPKKEGSGKDEVSDIRKFVVWLAHLSVYMAPAPPLLFEIDFPI
ncbi:MAG: hypothetical protein PHP23_09210 [Desulfobacterales bacterium]|nr:hypothetical protein [Desulfobacterales bacterium]MDD4071852.1 hypothetical protein [Desulfobacterales bacterium]MDD4391513.1 hypothetical protein [Desulfobacterales bacterium]